MCESVGEQFTCISYNRLYSTAQVSVREEIDTDNYGNGEIPYPFIVLHNTHSLKRHESTVRIAVYNLSTHILATQW